MSRQPGAPDELGFEAAVAEALGEGSVVESLPVVIGEIDHAARKQRIEARLASLNALISDLESERFDLDWEMGKLRVEEEGLFGPLDDDDTVEDLGIWPVDANESLLDRLLDFGAETYAEKCDRMEHEEMDRELNYLASRGGRTE